VKETSELKGLEVDGIWCEEPGIMRTAMKKYFEIRFDTRWE